MYLAPLVYLLMNHISIWTNAPGVGVGQEIELRSNLQNIYSQEIERLMLFKHALLVYLWMNHIFMVN